jgi:hypothetical protein
MHIRSLASLRVSYTMPACDTLVCTTCFSIQAPGVEVSGINACLRVKCDKTAFKFFAVHLNPRRYTTDRAMLGRAGSSRCRTAVVASGLPRAGFTSGVPLLVDALVVRSIQNLAWAKVERSRLTPV